MGLSRGIVIPETLRVSGAPSLVALALAAAALASPAGASAQSAARGLGNPTQPARPSFTEQVAPPPRPRWSYGVTLGYASLGALGGTLAGGVVGGLLGIAAAVAEGPDAGLITAGVAAAVGWLVGLPWVVGQLGDDAGAGGSPWWAFLGEVAVIALGMGAGLLIGAAIDPSQGPIPGMMLGCAIGLSLSPIIGAIGYWRSQPRRVSREASRSQPQ